MPDESLEQVELVLDARRALAQLLKLLVHLVGEMPELLVHLAGQMPVLLVHLQGKAVDPALKPTTLQKNQSDNGNADAKHGDDFVRKPFHEMPL